VCPECLGSLLNITSQEALDGKKITELFDLFDAHLWGSERHVATPKTGLPHAPTRGFGAPGFGLACY